MLLPTPPNGWILDMIIRLLDMMEGPLIFGRSGPKNYELEGARWATSLWLV